MLTMKTINKAIADKGIDAELVKGKGYFYFAGEDVAWCDMTSVYVYRLNELSLEAWLDQLNEFINESKASEGSEVLDDIIMGRW